MYSSIVKKFPRRGEEVFHSKLFQNILGDIDKWIASWSSFLQQMVSLLQNKQHEKHLANRNIQATRRELSNMQDAYDSIVKHTFPYFDVQAVKEEEKIWYYRLSKTIAFYFSNPNSIGYTVHAKDVVVHWWDQQEKNRIEKIRELGNRLGIFLDAEFIIPTHIIEKGDLLQASIGIRGLRWEELEQEQAKIFVGFSDLVDTDIDYSFSYPL